VDDILKLYTADMSTTNRLLTTVLRAYQSVHDPEQTTRALSSTTLLLTTLSNPLNLTVLTSQLLTAPAIWERIDGLHTCNRIIGIFSTASVTVRQRNIDRQQNPLLRLGSGLSCDDWAKAIMKGADDKSPRWRHLLAIGGILVGMESQGRRGLSRELRRILEEALVSLINLTLLNPVGDTDLALEVAALVLSYSFDLLSDGLKRGLDYDALTPVMVHAMIGREGYHGGYFLNAINLDVKKVPGNRYDWPSKSPSFRQVQIAISKPLIASMGPLSRVIAHGLSHMADSRLVTNLLDDLSMFSNLMGKHWRQNRLSEIDPAEEESLLTPETRSATFPILWQVLKSTMFATVNTLRAIIARTLIDPVLGANGSAPLVASTTLHILRNLYFIISRQGSNAFSAYTFAFLTSIDILSYFPTDSKIFLRQIRPTYPGQIPTHPLDRNLDLYFLNTCEHFTILLTAEDNESIVVAAASPYLNPNAPQNFLDIFEAAHSAMLAALAAPQDASLATKIIPFYVQSLFSSFPRNLSPRQFRLAFKTLLQITTPPAPLSAMEPLLADTLLELLYHKALQAPTLPLNPALAVKCDADVDAKDNQSLLSEQAILMSTLLDGLPFLTCSSLEEWLPLAARLLNMIGDDNMREVCKARFWEVLDSGEMDVDRAAVCVAWWTTRGGRELVLFGRESQNDFLMSGGLAPRDGARL
jgi:hypothetical protein